MKNNFNKKAEVSDGLLRRLGQIAESLKSHFAKFLSQRTANYTPRKWRVLSVFFVLIMSAFSTYVTFKAVNEHEGLPVSHVSRTDLQDVKPGKALPAILTDEVIGQYDQIRKIIDSAAHNLPTRTIDSLFNSIKSLDTIYQTKSSNQNN